MSIAGLIVGLGNPGPEYALTRHNIGFLAIDALLEHSSRITPLGKNSFKGEAWQGYLPGLADPWIFVKPLTFMNLSGECVQPLAAWYKIEPKEVLVLHDEVDIAPGRMKCKLGGGNAGHNGLKSITQRFGTPDFWRLRIGVGRSPYEGTMVNWVLGRMDGQEQAQFTKLVPTLCDVVKLWAQGDTRRAIQTANSYKDEPESAAKNS